MSNKNKKFLIYLLVFLLSFSILFLKFEPLDSVRMHVVEFSSFSLRIILFPFREVKKILFYRSTYKKYMQLNQEADILKQQLVEQEEVLLENKRLQELLDFKEKFVFSSIAANVIGRNPTNWSSSIIIDKGRKHGLKVGMPVVSALGVLGKVAEVGKTVSRVLLLTDPNFSVAVIIQRNRESGLISGTLQNVCRMRYLSADADIRRGDKVITSKISSAFPEGLLVGVVNSVEESQSSPTLECLVEPAISISPMEEVFIILQK